MRYSSRQGHRQTREAHLCAKHHVAVPYRAVATIDEDYGPWGVRRIMLTCGHEAGHNHPRKDGKHPCYECQIQRAEAKERGTP
jgi:hypothetical protein